MADATPISPNPSRGPGRRAVSVTVPGDPVCTVVIATKNRAPELRAAIRSTLLQDVPLELIVLDDGSTDDTPAMLRSEFSQVRTVRSDRSLGYIAQRNRGAAMAGTGTIVSIDDDAEFPSPGVIARSIIELDHPRVAAVGIPYVDVHKSDGVKQLAPDSRGLHVLPAYVGTAHVVRRDVFLKLGGYRESHRHQGEEADFGLRLLNAGYVIRAGTADPIRHLESPKRDLTRLYQHAARNHVLIAWHNIPLPYLPFRLLGMMLNLLRSAARKKCVRPTIVGLWHGFRDLLLGKLDPRRPVSRRAYRVARRLDRSHPHPFAAIEADLPFAEPLAPPALPA